MEKYEVVIDILCSYYNFEYSNLKSFLSKKENKYIFLLLMKEFNCFFSENLKRDLSLRNDRSLKNNLRRAEEKLLINKEFRIEYFYIGEKIKKTSQ